MELGEKAEEILESLWISSREHMEPAIPVESFGPEPVEQLLKAGYISVTEGKAELTGKGSPEATNIVRRHRLAERLLADVLGAGDNLMHEKACKFEHLLDRGLDENICILLGHPKVCPHGKPIPPGRCCRQEQSQAQRLVSSLSQLIPGQNGRVAYIYAPESAQLHKLVAMGILPGAPIRLIQSFPSYVFQTRQTQYAVDKDIADAIYIRLGEEKIDGQTDQGQQQRHGWRKRGLAKRLGLW